MSAENLVFIQYLRVIRTGPTMQDLYLPIKHLYMSLALISLTGLLFIDCINFRLNRPEPGPRLPTKKLSIWN